MHQYLKAIGFGNVKSKHQENEILESAARDFSHHELVSQDDEFDICEYQKEYGPGIGIAVCGVMDVDEAFQKEFYFPYFFGTGITSHADIVIEKRMDREAYVGICEDVKVGISLIFYLQNAIEYKKQKQKGSSTIKYTSVTLSGLCNEGTILLPVQKDKEQEKKQQEDARNRMMLMSAAKTGDPAAIESLTLDDIDTYSKVSRRLITEDIFSIVDTYIMPFGVECDVYSILGEIRELNKVENEYTKNELYIMQLEVNELTFDVCVPAEGLVGEPAVGRRFKGNIWMQGFINFK